MTYGTCKYASFAAAILLMASCLVFTAPGLLADSIEAAAVIEEEYTEEISEEIEEILEAEIIEPDELEPAFEEEPVVSYAHEVKKDQKMPTMMQPATPHGGKGFAVISPFMPNLEEEEPEVEETVDYPIFGNSFVPKVENKVDPDTIIPEIVKRSVIITIHHEAVVDIALVQEMMFEVLLTAILANDEIAVPDRDNDVEVEEVDDESIEPVSLETEANEDGSEVFVVPVLNIPYYISIDDGGDIDMDVLRATTVVATLA